ncbi:HAD family hydrolase [Streptomyces decoyicus]|uniref:HAD family hydrolase n=1 Tax=Streptomyces decoyicus TaxID=249567 RepID=A0ABZ1FU88_9ACTN|nr:HAD family hydrolase [Streptomyces decoyicus]WSB73502.1 HAD family hydrolase [Streptomyces decoyicus]
MARPLRTPSRLIASDLDGTLLDAHGKVSPRTLAVVGRLQREGHVFVLATARPVRDTRPVALSFDCPPIAICGNGSIVFDFSRNRILAHHPMERAHAVDAIRTLRRRYPDVRLGAEHGLDLLLEERFKLAPAWAQQARRVSVLDTALDEHGFGKLIVQLDGAAQHYCDEVRDALPGLEVTMSGETFCEVTRLGVTKAMALESVARRYGLARAGTVAFGDMPNDLPMLAWAGTAVAVANAHPAVLASVGEVTASHDADGVAVWLEHMPPVG